MLLFQGFNDATPVNVVSEFCGFITIFIGVFMLNAKKEAAPPTITAVVVEKSRRSSRSLLTGGEEVPPEAYLLKTYENNPKETFGA